MKTLLWLQTGACGGDSLAILAGRLLTVEAAHRVQFSPGLSPAVAAAVGPVTDELRCYLEGSA